MPKLSDHALLQQAIDVAQMDRLSLAQAYDNTGEQAREALAAARQFEALRGRRISQLDPAAQQLAFEVLVWAEQWEAGLADACSPGSKERREAACAAAAYRQLRVRRWGLSQYEAALRRGSSVPIEQVLRDGLRDVDSRPRPPGHSAPSELGSVSDHDDKAKGQSR